LKIKKNKIELEHYNTFLFMALEKLTTDFDDEGTPLIMKILAGMDGVTSQDIDTFKERKVSSDWYEYFDGLEENQKRQIVILSKLSPEEFEVLQEQRKKGERVIGMHDLNNIMTLYDGMQLNGIIN